MNNKYLKKYTNYTIIPKQDLISVIIPIYKINNKYLNECIMSIINQTYKNIEILLIINEEDKNKQLLDKYKDQRIRILGHKTNNVSKKRNIGIKNSKGKYIAFIDDDDYIINNYLMRLYENLNLNKSDISMCSCKLKYKHISKNNRYFKEKEKIFKTNDKLILIQQIICKSPYAKNIKTRCGSVWAKLYKKEFILKNNILFDEHQEKMEDSIFNIKCFLKSNKISYFNECNYYYRKRKDSVTNKYDNLIIEKFEYFFKELTKLNIDNKMIKDSINNRIIISIYSYIRLYIFNKNNKISLKNKMKIINNTLNKKMYKEALININYKYLTNSQKLFVFLIKIKKIIE